MRSVKVAGEFIIAALCVTKKAPKSWWLRCGGGDGVTVVVHCKTTMLIYSFSSVMLLWDVCNLLCA